MGRGWSFPTNNPPITAVMQIAPDLTLGGLMNSPSVPGGRAWAFANGAVMRPFASSLASGQTFSVVMDGGSSGIAIGFFNPPDPYDYFYITSVNSRDYILWTSFGSRSFPTSEDTGIAAIDGPVVISLTGSDAAGYNVLGLQSLAAPGVSATIAGGFPPVAVGEVEMGGNASSMVYVNNMVITPEPSALCLAGLAAIGLQRRRMPLRKSA